MDHVMPLHLIVDNLRKECSSTTTTKPFCCILVLNHSRVGYFEVITSFKAANNTVVLNYEIVYHKHEKYCGTCLSTSVT